MARKEHAQAVRDVRSAGNATVVKLAGEVDMNLSPSVHQTLVEILENRPARLIIDLTEVSYMDSSGVGVLVDTFRRMRISGGRLGLVGVAPRVLSILQITKLDQYFEMHRTVEEALAT